MPITSNKGGVALEYIFFPTGIKLEKLFYYDLITFGNYFKNISNRYRKKRLIIRHMHHIKGCQHACIGKKLKVWLEQEKSKNTVFTSQFLETVTMARQRG